MNNKQTFMHLLHISWHKEQWLRRLNSLIGRFNLKKASFDVNVDYYNDLWCQQPWNMLEVFHGNNCYWLFYNPKLVRICKYASIYYCNQLNEIVCMLFFCQSVYRTACLQLFTIIYVCVVDTSYVTIYIARREISGRLWNLFYEIRNIRYVCLSATQYNTIQYNAV